jgi:hypothetical protein
MGNAKLREFVEIQVLREHGSTTAIVRNNYGLWYRYRYQWKQSWQEKPIPKILTKPYLEKLLKFFFKVFREKN